MTAISGVMVPLIPPLMAVGIFSALYSVLLQANIIVDYGSTNNPDVWSTIFYVLSKVALNLIGVMFCYSVVAYFGGNPIFAILVGLTLSSRILLAGVSAPVADPGFGQFIVDPTKGISGWLLFKILDYPFVVTAYEGSVLPYVFAAFIVIFADKWIKTWMPTSVDIIFRPFLVYFLAVIPTLFIFGPLLGLIEMGLSQVVMTFEKDVTGIGVGLFAFLW
ncbi:PTS system, IIabc component [Spiroplasma clarkii]|nr:PTS transporter subunit EIIC [Spiroplasma clarkii]ARU91714.1 PTS system, IIabc component [Spiroplasma clarkii]